MLPYVKLSPEYTQTITWSNDPRDLNPCGAFSEEKSNLSSDFKVNGLHPIVKAAKRDKYILQDAKGIYYLWGLWDGHLLRVTDEWTEGLDSVEAVVDNIICNLYWVEEDTVTVFRPYSDVEL